MKSHFKFLLLLAFTGTLTPLRSAHETPYYLSPDLSVPLTNLSPTFWFYQKNVHVLATVAKWLECWPWHPRVLRPNPSQGHIPGLRICSKSSVRACVRGNRCVCLSHPPFFPLSLKMNTNQKKQQATKEIVHILPCLR